MHETNGRTANVLILDIQHCTTPQIILGKSSSIPSWTAWVLDDKRRPHLRGGHRNSPSEALESLLEATAEILANDFAKEFSEYNDGPFPPDQGNLEVREGDFGKSKKVHDYGTLGLGRLDLLPGREKSNASGAASFRKNVPCTRGGVANAKSSTSLPVLGRSSAPARQSCDVARRSGSERLSQYEPFSIVDLDLIGDQFLGRLGSFPAVSSSSSNTSTRGIATARDGQLSSGTSTNPTESASPGLSNSMSTSSNASARSGVARSSPGLSITIPTERAPAPSSSEEGERARSGERIARWAGYDRSERVLPSPSGPSPRPRTFTSSSGHEYMLSHGDSCGLEPGAPVYWCAG
jgi:hypothetical protein